MLKRDTVESQEEDLRERISMLSDGQRKRFYSLAKTRLKDPDTYAVLNYFFLAGLHHYYLGVWLRGTINLGIFITGCVLLFSPCILFGILMICGITVVELYSLFRSQIIVQHKNNGIMETILKKIQDSPNV